MPSRPVTACIRVSDKDILIPCCRFSGGPVSRAAIETMLETYAPGYGVMKSKYELLLYSYKLQKATRIQKFSWVVIEHENTPKVLTPLEFEKKYYPLHHTVDITKEQEGD